MPQKITIASIEIKEGEKDGKPWKNFIFIGKDKTKANMFEPNKANLKPSELGVGDTIDAEIELKGKYANIKSFKKVGEKTVGEPHLPNAPFTPKPSSNRDDIIAEQVAFKGVIDLLCAKVIDLKHP